MDLEEKRAETERAMRGQQSQNPLEPLLLRLTRDFAGDDDLADRLDRLYQAPPAHEHAHKRPPAPLRTYARARARARAHARTHARHPRARARTPSHAHARARTRHTLPFRSRSEASTGTVA